MNIDNKIQEIFKKARKNPAIQLEKAVLHFTGQVCEQMDKLKINRADLARSLNKKPAYVTRILNGSCNLTFKTAVGIAMALESSFKPNLELETVNNLGVGNDAALYGNTFPYLVSAVNNVKGPVETGKTMIYHSVAIRQKVTVKTNKKEELFDDQEGTDYKYAHVG